MKKKFTLLLLLTALFSMGMAHPKQAGITGKVMDEDGSPVGYATVMLLSMPDSTLAKAGYTTDDGTFALTPLAGGNYRLRVSIVGYTAYVSEVFELAEGERRDFGTVKLAATGADMEEVKITAEKPIITVKPDMTVFNVENSINAQGENALDLMRKSPGVIVDNNDNLLLQGKSGVRVYINGKPSPLSADDLANYLRSMQSTEIEAIEIITNPSSKYDAEGNAGIINIRLRKDKNLGANATVTLGYNQGIYAKYNGSVLANYRTKKMNAFGSYNLGTGTRQHFMNFYREQAGLVFDQQTVVVSDYTSHGFRGGVDLYLAPKHTLGVLVNGNLSPVSQESNSTTEISQQGANVVSSLLDAASFNEQDNENMNYNLNYRFDDQKKGRSLSMDADYGTYRINTDSYQPNFYRDPDDGTLILDRSFTSYAPTDIDITTFKADYEQKLGKGKLGIGGKVAFVTTNNTFDFYDLNNGVEVLDTNRSNTFVYDENINAAYVNYQVQLGKWGIQAGLRGEQTNSLGQLTAYKATQNERVERHYFNLFPSGGVTFSPNRMNTLRATYSRRIDRPNYQSLNPFEFKLDELSYRRGNPFLRPQYTNNVELGHTFMYTLNTSVSYAVTTDFFTQYTDTTEGTRSFMTQENLSTRKVASFNVSYPFSITKWWSTYSNFSLYNVRNEGDFGEGKEIDISQTSYSIFHQSTFKLPADFSIQLNGFYNSPGIWGANFENSRFWGIEAGAQKKLFGGRGNLKMSVSDIFFTMQWRGEQTFGGLYMIATGGWESRQLKTSFTYLFGNQEVKGARKRKTGLEDESGRVGGDGGMGR